MSLKDKRVVVTGGSRGLGLGLVEALVDQGAKVWVVARGADDLAVVRARLGVETIVADVADAAAARRIVTNVRPEVLVLNAGAIPGMGPIDQISWADFTVTWETDVKAGLFWLQAALTLPMAPGGRILVSSSGAAIQGSPQSGGYAGAKRMLWLMVQYADALAAQKNLGLKVQAIVLQQMVGGTSVGGAGAKAYALAQGVEPEAVLARFGAPLPPRSFGEHVVRILTDPQYDRALALGLKGDTGITMLDGAAA